MCCYLKSTDNSVSFSSKNLNSTIFFFFFCEIVAENWEDRNSIEKISSFFEKCSILGIDLNFINSNETIQRWDLQLSVMNDTRHEYKL